MLTERLYTSDGAFAKSGYKVPPIPSENCCMNFIPVIGYKLFKESLHESSYQTLYQTLYETFYDTLYDRHS